MSLFIKVVVALVIIIFIAVAALRVRKLRRDELRDLSRPVERRLMSPPPSPYQPSKGFRLLDGTGEEQRRAEPPRPRLDSGHEYVFSDTQLGAGDDARLASSRHDEKWALSRSSHRTAIPSFSMRAILVVVVIGLLAAFVYYYENHDNSPPKGTTTTTVRTTTSRPSTTTSKPSSSAKSLAPLRFPTTVGSDHPHVRVVASVSSWVTS